MAVAAELREMNEHEPLMTRHEELVEKNVALGDSFNRYLFEHPDLLDRLPRDAVIVFLPLDDPELAAFNLEQAERHRGCDDRPERPVVHVHLLRPGRLVAPVAVSIPVDSRLPNIVMEARLAHDEIEAIAA